ncbi:MAG: hypothetical protein GF353_09365 [Candidatus Lokiarchaeota archaeon]|nr:hypothetical protein [Candidatus Lokiarchaeota archaeon]
MKVDLGCVIGITNSFLNILAYTSFGKACVFFNIIALDGKGKTRKPSNFSYYELYNLICIFGKDADKS